MPKTESFDRDLVMDQIMTRFWEKGYNGTSMQEIVDASGLNRSSLYNSFGDKFKLYLASLKHYRKKFQEPTFEKLNKLSPKEAIRGFYEDVLNAIDDQTQDKGCLITNCTTELANQNKEIDNYVSESVKDTKDFFRELILIGIDNKDFSADTDVEQTTLYLYSCFVGIRITAMQVKSKTAIQSTIDKILVNL